MSEHPVERPSDVPVSHAQKPPAKPPKPLRSRRRLWLYARIGLALAVIAGDSVLAAPFVMMRRVRLSATECLAKYDKPRGARLPDCSSPIPELSRLAKVSYVHHDATYRAEELWARIMMAEYENACVGSPEPSLRAQTAGFVDEAETVVGKGSQRIQFDELGPVVSAPHLGKLAASFGDRRALIEHSDWWTNWPVRVHAFQAALIEGDLAKAVQMARRYYDWDPRDPDLRTMMGAVMCLGSDPGRGLELLTRVPTDRADKRYAAIARNYGEVLAIMAACAKKAGVDAPTPPQVSHAGIADLEEARLIEDMRLTKLQALRREDSDKVVGMLQEERGLDNNEPGMRAMLLAAVALYDDRFGEPTGPLSANVVANLATPREHEAPLGPSLALAPRDILGEAPGLRPTLSAAALAKASSKLEKLAAHAVPLKDVPPVKDAALIKAAPTDKDAPSDPEAQKEPPPKTFGSADPAGALLKASAALATYSAIAAARAGDVDTALASVDNAARLSHANAQTRALAGGSVAYVGGDAKRALERLAGPESDDAGIEASCAIVSALAHASLGDQDAAKRDTATALTLAAKARDARTTLEARWLDLAFGDAVAPTGPLRPPTFMGLADPMARWESIGQSAIDDNLAAWRAAMGASDEDRLAFRYALVRMRGDAPILDVPYLVAGARLGRNGASGPSIEVWLDTLSADDAPRMPLSAYVWSRLEAARIRGDKEAADTWEKRLVTIRALKYSEPDLEIARFIGL